MEDLIFYTEDKTGGIDNAKALFLVFIFNVKDLFQIVEVRFKQLEDPFHGRCQHPIGKVNPQPRVYEEPCLCQDGQ